MGDTTMRFGSVRSRIVYGENRRDDTCRAPDHREGRLGFII
jgi:hypothetical protein